MLTGKIKTMRRGAVRCEGKRARALSTEGYQRTVKRHGTKHKGVKIILMKNVHLIIHIFANKLTKGTVREKHTMITILIVRVISLRIYQKACQSGLQSAQ